MSVSTYVKSTVIGLFLFPLAASAQTAAPSDPGPAVPVEAAPAAPAAPPSAPVPVPTPPPPSPAPSPKASAEIGPNAYTLKSSEGGFALKINGLVQLDGRFFAKDSNPQLVDTFLARRVIPYIQGTLGSNVSFLISPDFGQGSPGLTDAWGEIKLHDWARLRFGKFRSPIGLERLQPPAQIVFPEFALATQLTPVRDLGIQISGEDKDGGVGYAVGIFNGAPDNGQCDKDSASPKEAGGRIYVRPLKLANVPFDGEILLGFAGTYGKKTPAPGTAVRGSETLPNYTSAGVNAIAPFSSSTTDQNANTVVSGQQTRLNAHLYAVVGPASLLAEYIRSDLRLAQGWIGTRIANSGWNATATVFLFGGRPSFNPVKDVGEYGAIELAGKVSRLSLDDKRFEALDPTSPTKTLADPSKAVSQATEFEGGVNYYYSPNIRFMLDYAQTRFKGGAGKRDAVTDRETEHLITGRAQLNF